MTEAGVENDHLLDICLSPVEHLGANCELELAPAMAVGIIGLGVTNYTFLTFLTLQMTQRASRSSQK